VTGRQLVACLREITAHNVAIVASRAQRRAEEPAPPAEVEEPETKPIRRLKPYILVVEDDGDLRDIIKQELCDCGYIVKTAKHGIEALEIMNREYLEPQRYGAEPRLPSLILLDLHMPQMDGMNFYATLISKPQYREVHVLAMSDSQSIGEFSDWCVQTAGLDVDEVPEGLPKPVGFGDLVQKVARLAGLP